jgi:hypothetical protein
MAGMAAKMVLKDLHGHWKKNSKSLKGSQFKTDGSREIPGGGCIQSSDLEYQLLNGIFKIFALRSIALQCASIKKGTSVFAV